METDLGAAKSSFKWRLPVHGPSWTQIAGIISVSYFEEIGIFSPSFVMSVAVISAFDGMNSDPVVRDVHHIANGETKNKSH